eukprot:TRINITY_DN30523_c0_g1_i2.p2 TRINITY_DN30523_c0_g1~~TRINITY_DN30523_c0_g1_i2.p2  ORF type:complete len:300 (+),score=72.85 TRINITY_DN30523_c0_g1_i2:110-901(+)
MPVVSPQRGQEAAAEAVERLLGLMQGRWVSEGPGSPVHIVSGTSVYCETTEGVAELEISAGGVVALVGVELLPGAQRSCLRWADGDVWVPPPEPQRDPQQRGAQCGPSRRPISPSRPRRGSPTALPAAAPSFSPSRGVAPPRPSSPTPQQRPAGAAGACHALGAVPGRSAAGHPQPTAWLDGPAVPADLYGGAPGGAAAAMQGGGGGSLLEEERQAEHQRDALSIDDHRECVRAETQLFLSAPGRREWVHDNLSNHRTSQRFI